MPGVLEFPCSVARLPNGNTLIADAGDEIGLGSEVLEVDPAGQIVWLYGDGLRFAHSAVRTRCGNTLIADTGNNRVIEVSRANEIVFSTDDLRTLSDGSRLNYPNSALELADGNLLITDRNNDRFLIMDKAGRVHWQYGELQHPHSAEMLRNGHFIVADSDANRVVELSPAGEIVWTYGDSSPRMLNWPRHARRLDNGNTLIADSRNARILEVTREGNVVWFYRTGYLSKFYAADKLANGHVLISDQQGHRVLEVDAAGTVIWMFRNYIYPNVIRSQLANSDFGRREEWGWPKDWILVTRLSEGGGRVIWDDGAGYSAPGLEYDRDGGLFLQQTVRATPGTTYHLTGLVRSERLDGFAFLQIAFVDALGAAIQDAAETPRGRILAGTEGWLQDSFEAVAPTGATAMEVRLFITGRGRAWMRDLDLHTHRQDSRGVRGQQDQRACKEYPGTHVEAQILGCLPSEEVPLV